MSRYALVIDLNRCIGCHGCEVVCKNEHAIALGERWNKVWDMGPYGDYPDIEMYFLPKQCQQCAEAPCVEVCPTGASYRTEDDVVQIDAETCIGCQLCLSACPYDVRQYNASLGIVEKCTMCRELTEKGEKPMCVRVCATGARFWGDLDDPESDAAKALAKADPDSIHTLNDDGNGPRTCYILDAKRATWVETY